MNMVSEIAWYRRGAGQGENNLGSLVWQLNDIWQGTSWSSIEYSGRWKVLHYGMTGAYTPVVIYPFWTSENQTLEVIVSSDRWQTVKGTAQLTWFDWHGKQLETSKHSFSVPTLNNSLILKASGFEKILPHGQSPENVFLMLNLTAKVEGKTVTHEQVVRYPLHHLMTLSGADLDTCSSIRYHLLMSLSLTPKYLCNATKI